MKNGKLYIILILIGILGLSGYYYYNKPVSSLSRTKPDHVLTSAELQADYERDEEKANADFLDKVIEVSGVIEKIEKSETNYSIYLATDNMMSYVICELDDDIKSPDFKVGDLVFVKGLCTGYLMDVVLVRSLIIKK